MVSSNWPAKCLPFFRVLGRQLKTRTCTTNCKRRNCNASIIKDRHKILKSCADANCPVENIVELANGCICCTVADDFIPTIEALMAMPQRPDHILIETSGLALPKPLLKAFDWPAIRSRITVDGVVALADAEAVAAGRFAPDVAAVDAQRAADDSLDHETPLSEVFEDQIACADIVLLTKADLAGEAGIAAARALIESELPRALPILTVTDGTIDPRVILGLNAAAEDDLAARPNHHDGHDDHEHDDFDSVVIDLPEIADIEDLVARIQRLADEQHVLRVKGYVAVQGKPMRLLVQAVGARVRHEIARLLPQGEPRREEVAAVLGLTDRTLQRRLQAESTSYQQLLDDTRRELARQYLGEPRHSLAEVADLLGFADQSNLFRACKRWFGLPPGQYRAQVLYPEAEGQGSTQAA